MKYILILSLFVCGIANGQHTIEIKHKYYTSQFDTVLCAGILNDYWQTLEHYKQVKASGIKRQTIGDFTQDNLIPKRFQVVSKEDYVAWNKANPNEKKDIGHIVPYQAMSFDRATARETMVFNTNTMPQDKFFNEHAWSFVEAIVFDSLGSKIDSIHVFTGVLISISHPKKMAAAFIPDYYYKVAVYKGIKTAWLGANNAANKDTKPNDNLIDVTRLKTIILQYYPKSILPF